MNAEQMREDFAACRGDGEKWQWLIDNGGGGYPLVYLDNDDTFVDFGEDIETVHFYDYIDGPGFPILLSILGLTAEEV